MAANGGLDYPGDLAAYRAVEREPLRGSYRGYEIVTMAPPSSGGMALLQMLGMLEPRNVGSLGLNSAAKIHLFTEVMRRAFRDRAEYLGDPDFVQRADGAAARPGLSRPAHAGPSIPSMQRPATRCRRRISRRKSRLRPPISPSSTRRATRWPSPTR